MPNRAVPDTIQRAYTFLEQSQVREDVSKKECFFRHSSKGGWPFSTYDHGWPISDCTAEGLGAVLAMHTSGLIEQGDQHVDRERMCEAVDLILSFQNNDGGWATYENTRGPAWLEVLNPSGVFGDIMVDYSYNNERIENNSGSAPVPIL